MNVHCNVTFIEIIVNITRFKDNKIACHWPLKARSLDDVFADLQTMNLVSGSSPRTPDNHPYIQRKR